MRLRAIATFSGRYGHVRTGEIFHSEDGYGRALIQGRKAVELPNEAPQPTHVQAFDRAPLVKAAPKGKDSPAEAEPSPNPLPSTAALRVDGPARRSPSSLLGLRRRRKTPTPAEGE